MSILIQCAVDLICLHLIIIRTVLTVPKLTSDTLLLQTDALQGSDYGPHSPGSDNVYKYCSFQFIVLFASFCLWIEELQARATQLTASCSFNRHMPTLAKKSWPWRCFKSISLYHRSDLVTAFTRSIALFFQNTCNESPRMHKSNQNVCVLLYLLIYQNLSE